MRRDWVTPFLTEFMVAAERHKGSLPFFGRTGLRRVPHCKLIDPLLDYSSRKSIQKVLPIKRGISDALASRYLPPSNSSSLTTRPAPPAIMKRLTLLL